MILPIVQNGHPALRELSQSITNAEFGTPELKELVKNMQETLLEVKDGVGLAAPQVGVSKRVFIIDPRVFEGGALSPDEPLVYINPKIIKLSAKKTIFDEGCLSVRPLYGKIKRSIKATIRAYDENGKVFERGGSGLLAEIFQHEVDHLNGILFVDTATDVAPYIPKEQENSEHE